MRNASNRSRLVAVSIVGVAVLVAVVAMFLVLTRPGTPPTPTSPPSTLLDVTTPQGAVTAFFNAFAQARATDNPAVVEPYVTGKSSSAYQTVDAFLSGQEAIGKASVITTNALSEFRVDTKGQIATVTVTQQLGGYDIDVKTGEPRESPTLLPATKFRVVLRQTAGRWAVDEFEAVQ